MDYRRIVIRVVVGVAVLASAAQADTLCVDDDNCPGPGDGSELNPYCSIQTAIDNAVDTDEIVVAPGTYLETIDFLGKAVWLHSSEGRDVTIIDATGLWASVVTCESGEDTDTVIDGFTITGGDAEWGGGMRNYNSSPTVVNCTFSGNNAEVECGPWGGEGSCGYGGGMCNDNSSPMVVNCTFSENTAFDYGGGMLNWLDSSPTVTNCTFSGNSAGYGGGLFNGEGSPTVTDCTFSGNSAGVGGGMYNSGSTMVTDCTFEENFAHWYGGGMNNATGSPTVVNCRFSGNTVTNHPSYVVDGGGGMYNYESNPTVTDCTFSGNEAGHGGGMYNRTNSSPTVTDCKFTDNWAGDGGGGMINRTNSSPTVTDCRFEGNTTDEGNGGGILTEFGNPTIDDTRFCENTPDHIWGDWDGDDNTFYTFCRLFGFDTIDVGVDDVLNLLGR